MAEEQSTLGLLFEIAVDPSKAILATESFRDEAGKALKEFEDDIAEVMTHSVGITKEFAIGMTVGVGAVTALSVAMFELAEKSAETGEKIYELHEQSGLSAESLSGLMAIAKETGGSFDSLGNGLARATV